MILEFHECETCAAKPGSPVLCAGCLHNRAVILAAHNLIAQLEFGRNACRGAAIGAEYVALFKTRAFKGLYNAIMVITEPPEL